ncbi:fused DSP-PTPase phosphatase/NAD kinase-like protein [Parahaliea maris]|nr:sulfur transferase domain-containing protein [Parahaliea maris]
MNYQHSALVTLRRSLAALATGLMLLPAAMADVPFGDRVSEKIENYHRHRPMIATSGSLQPGAAEELSEHGFRTVVDLRTAGEEPGTEETAVEQAGMHYVNIPLGRDWPAPEAVARFAKLVEDPANQPLLMHCASGNRAAVMWAAYQLGRGRPLDQVLEEAYTIGLRPDREAQVREHASQ